jgi:hypothetical protein
MDSLDVSGHISQFQLVPYRNQKKVFGQAIPRLSQVRPGVEEQSGPSNTNCTVLDMGVHLCESH